MPVSKENVARTKGKWGYINGTTVNPLSTDTKYPNKEANNFLYMSWILNYEEILAMGYGTRISLVMGYGIRILPRKFETWQSTQSQKNNIAHKGKLHQEIACHRQG